MDLTGAARQRLTDAIRAAYDDPEHRKQHTEEYAYYPVKWVDPYLARRRKVFRHCALDRARGFQLIGHPPNGAEEIGLCVREVDLLGVEVVLGQCQAGFGLVEVGGTADTLLVAQADLVIDALMGLQVVAGQFEHFAAHQHVQVNLYGPQCQAL